MPAQHYGLTGKMIRQFASEIEQGSPVNVTIFDHGDDVVAPEYGDTIIDRTWVGRTIVIQTEHATLDMLLRELQQFLRNKNGMRG